MGQVFAALGCDTYIGLGTDSPKPSVDGAVWEWECSDGSWQAYDDVAQRLLEEHWMKMKSDETTDDHIVLLPTVEGGYAANLADMTETEIGRKAGFRKLQRCKPWDRTMRRLTQSIVDSSKFGEVRPCCSAAYGICTAAEPICCSMLRLFSTCLRPGTLSNSA
eukprot:SAG31_NODE_3115_length_4659_cov_2.837939_1_plen_163_part_00